MNGKAYTIVVDQAELVVVMLIAIMKVSRPDLPAPQIIERFGEKHPEFVSDICDAAKAALDYLTTCIKESGSRVTHAAREPRIRQ